MKNQKKLFAFLFAILAIVQIQADNTVSKLLEWNFYGSEITGKELQSPAIIVDHSLEQAVLVRGEGAPGNNGYTHGFVATIQPSELKEDAIENDVYLEFKLQPKVGAEVKLSEMIVQLRSQTECYYQWMYAINDGEMNELTDVVEFENTSVGVFQPPLVLSAFEDLQNLTHNQTVTFRIYVWGGEKVQGFGFGKSTAAGTAGYGPSITVGGEVVKRSDSFPIAGWDFESYTGVTEGSLNASTLDDMLQYAILGRGIGFTAASLNFSYVSSSINLPETKTEAITHDDYFEIHMKVDTDEKVSLNSLNYKYRRNNAGPEGYKWMYSINGNAFADIGEEAEDSAEFNQAGQDYSIDLTKIDDFSQLEQGDVVKLRMYIWGSGATNQVFGFGRQYVGSVAVPGVNTVYVLGSYSDFGSGVENLQKDSPYHISIQNENILLTKNEEIPVNTSFKLIDLTGKIVFNQLISSQSNTQVITIPWLKRGGVYILSVNENNQVVYKQKIVL